MAALLIPSRLHPIISSSRRKLKRPASLTLSPTRPNIHFLDSFANDDSNHAPSSHHIISPHTRHYSTLANPKSPPFTPHQHQSRSLTIPPLSWPETIFGLTPLLLTTFHSIHIPYWGGIMLTNILVRSAMVPLVVKGAKTAVGIGVVAPEVQYLISNFRNDFGALKKKEIAGGGEELRRGQWALVRYTVESLRGIFKLHKVNLLDVFKSPLLQIPIFWYFSLDLRAVINGSDPILAQALVDTTFLHISDLTEPDPYYTLPIATGALLYFNVETAVGKRALSGETSSQSKLASTLKDFFQSLAIFMPCFMVQQPSGVQIYLLTSMVFSLCQSVALRNDGVRVLLGLPPMYTKPKGMEEGKFVKEFMEMMKERAEAKARGEFVLGEGVLRLGGMPARVGRRKKSSIEVGESDDVAVKESDGSDVKAVEIELPMYTVASLLVNPQQFAVRPSPLSKPSVGASIPDFTSDPTLQSMPDIPIDVMEKANRGEKPVKIEMASEELLEQSKKSEGPIDVNRLKMKRSRQKGKGKKGR